MVTTERLSIPPRYRLLEEVGQGGMAVVYRARDESLRRDVAIKVLHPHLAKDVESKGRFEREAQAIAKLKHDNIPAVFDYSGADAEGAYIVSEFIDGQTLRQWLGKNSLKHPEIGVLITLEICAALAHAHELGIIHRDVKPENVMIRRDGVIKLMDFGIAQVLDLQRMTVTGQLLGSPAYMAPELIEGKPLDVRSDVFSAGVVFYELITGHLPFAGKNPHEVLHRITEGRFPDPRTHNKLVSDQLGKIVARALSRHPEGRYPDVLSFAADLRGYVAEAGLENVRGELAAFFTGPASYEAALEVRLVHGLVACAEHHVQERKMPRALGCWNRALAVDPANPSVLAALARLEGRHRRRTAAVALLAVASLGGLSAALVAFAPRWFGRTSERLPVTPPFREHHEPSVAKTPLASAVTTSGNGAGAGMRRVAESSWGHRQARATPPRTSPVLSASAQGQNGQDGQEAGEGALAGVQPGEQKGQPHDLPTAGSGGIAARPTAELTVASPSPTPGASALPLVTKTFSLGPTPQNVDVYLDGMRMFAYGPDHTELAVPWDRTHLVELRSPSGCCFAERVEVGPDRPLPPDGVIARHLKWRPARLAVTLVPTRSDARILLTTPHHEGRRAVVRPGEEATIAFDVEGEATQDVELTVDLNGRVITDHATVRAGEFTTHVINDPSVHAEPVPTDSAHPDPVRSP